MNLRAIILCGALSAATLPAADSLTEEFQRALFEEEANRNLPVAIAGYEAVIKRLDEQRQLAATAVFRLGESYRKLGKTNEAVSAYERIIREFADQETLVKLSGQNLSILKPAISAAPTVDGNSASPARRWIDSWSPRWETFLETAKGFEPMSDVELHLLATAVPEAGIVEAKAKMQRAESAAERFKIHPEDFVIDAKNPNPVEALQLSKDELSNKRASALRALEALAASERRLAGRGDAVTGASGGSQAGGQDASMLALRVEYQRLKESLDQLEQPMTREQLRALAQVLLPDSTFARLDEMAVAARAELAGLLSQYGPEYGPVKAVQSRLDEINRSIEERIAAVLQAAQFKLKSLEQIVASQSGSTSPLTASLDPAARARQKVLLEQEIALVEGQLKDVRRKVDAGLVPVSEPIGKERELLNLRRKLAALDESSEAIKRQRELIEQELALVRQLVETTKLRVENGQASRNDLVELERQMLQLMREDLDLATRPARNAAATSESNMTAEEAEELLRVQALAANSPDLINKREKDGLPPLHLAIQRGHLNVVRYLLANGASPSATDGSLRTPLYLAAQRGQLNAVKVLLSAGVSIDQASNNGETPLHAATQFENDAVISFLLAEGANVNAQDKDGRTSLHFAAAKGLTNALALLIAGSANPEVTVLKQWENRSYGGNMVSYDHNGTPLHFAIANGQFAAAKLLLEKGANPNPPTGLASPLSLATRLGNTDLVHQLILAGSVTTNEPLIELAIERLWAVIPFLLESGANPNLVSSGQSSPPLHRAIGLFSDQWRRKQSQVPGSSPTGGRRQPGASARGGTGAQLMPVLPPTAVSPRALTPHEQEVLIEVNRNVLNQTRLGGLVDSGSDGDLDWAGIVKSMIEHGADINAVHSGRSILALFSPQPDSTPMEMIGWLLEKGADPNLGGWVTDSGVNIPTPLNGACRAGNVELAKLLIKHGAKLEGREEGDRWTTPLHVAVSMKHVELVKLLLENGANPNVVGADERTPLMGLLDKYIVPGGHGMSGPFGSVKDGQFYSSGSNIPELERAILEITRLLLGKGGRLNAELAEGFMPVHFAAAAKDRRFLELFLEFRADPNATNAFGVTPLHTAATKNQSENIRLLVQAGADVNRPDQNGDTPLHIAALRNGVQASEVLLELGADRERKNRFGRNPVQNLSNVKMNQRPPFGLPEYLDYIKNVTDVLGR